MMMMMIAIIMIPVVPVPLLILAAGIRPGGPVVGAPALLTLANPSV